MESSSPPPSPPPTLLWFTTHFYKKTLITPTPLDFPIISTAHELGINHCISGGCDSMWKLQRNRWVQLFTHGFPGCHTKFFMKKGIVSKLSITFLAHFMSLVSFYPPPPLKTSKSQRFHVLLGYRKIPATWNGLRHRKSNVKTLNQRILPEIIWYFWGKSRTWGKWDVHTELINVLTY